MRVSKPVWMTATAITAIGGVTAAVVIGASASDHRSPTTTAAQTAALSPDAAHSAASSSSSTSAASSASAGNSRTTSSSSSSTSASAGAATLPRSSTTVAGRAASVPPRASLATNSSNQAATVAKPTSVATRATTSPTPKPAATPATVSRPGGRPGPTNTGVPAGTNLSVINGDVVVTTPGTVIDAKDIKGALIIKASNVTVTRSLIEGRAGSDSVVISAGSGILLQDDEVTVAHPAVNIDSMSVHGATLNRLNIHGGVDGMKLSSNSVVENSWIHGLTYFSSDPAQGGKPTHNDTIQIMSGSNIKITGNYLQATSANNAAIQVTQDKGSTSGLYIAGNWADGGGCTFNFSGHGPGGVKLTMGGITVNSNRFGHATKFAGCAILTDLQTTISQTGNVFDDTGLPIVLVRHN